MSVKIKWFVRLGRSEWLRFTYERPVEDGIELLGGITRGARIGALGLKADGTYVQINGDYVGRLPSREVHQAIGRARLFATPSKQLRTQVARSESVPTVTIKQRRLSVPA